MPYQDNHTNGVGSAILGAIGGIFAGENFLQIMPNTSPSTTSQVLHVIFILICAGATALAGKVTGDIYTHSAMRRWVVCITRKYLRFSKPHYRRKKIKR